MQGLKEPEYTAPKLSDGAVRYKLRHKALDRSRVPVSPASKITFSIRLVIPQIQYVIRWDDGNSYHYQALCNLQEGCSEASTACS